MYWVWLWSASLSCMASLYMDTSINYVYYRGANEGLGSVSFTLTGDEFADATPDHPLFLRINLKNQTTLAATRVLLGSVDAAWALPIDVRLRLYSADASLALAASRDAVQIVRWVAGENEVWLRITQPTHTWIVDGDTPRPPSEDATVAFDLGIDGAPRGDAAAHQQNLPFNLRVGETPGEAGTDTLLCADLRHSTLHADFSTEALQNIGYLVFDADAEVGDGVYSAEAGTVLGIYFAQEYTVAFGKLLSMRLDLLPHQTRHLAKPLPGAGNLDVSGTLQMTLDHETGRAYLTGYLEPDSQFVLRVPEGSAHGLRSVSFIGDMGGDQILGEPFSLEGETVYRSITLAYTGPPIPLNNVLVGLQYTLAVPRAEAAGALSLQYEVWTARQGLGCDTALSSLAAGSWKAAEFGSGRIIAHLTRPEGDFTTHLLLANTTAAPVQASTQIFASDGTPGEVLETDVPAGQTVRVALEDHLPTDGGYLRIDEAAPVSASVVYQARGVDKAPAQLHETETSATRWRIYAGGVGLTFDGAAVVNVGEADAFLTVRQKAFDGTELGVVRLQIPLAANAKALLVFSDLFTPAPDSYYQVEAGQPLVLTALRGDLLSNFLWENRALALP